MPSTAPALEPESLYLTAGGRAGDVAGVPTPQPQAGRAGQPEHARTRVYTLHSQGQGPRASTAAVTIPQPRAQARRLTVQDGAHHQAGQQRQVDQQEGVGGGGAHTAGRGGWVGGWQAVVQGVGAGVRVRGGGRGA